MRSANHLHLFRARWRERIDFAVEHPDALSTAQHAALLQLISDRLGDFV
jgi:hypothetical protein